jgi:uncharacterized protein
LIEIKPYQKAIQQACHRYGVKRLELFGSHARHDHRKNSDMDFLVEFDLTRPCLFDRYLGLLEALQEVFAKKVDLVEISSIKNPILIKSINQDKKIVYEA